MDTAGVNKATAISITKVNPAAYCALMFFVLP